MCDCRKVLEEKLLAKVQEMRPDAINITGSLAGYGFIIKNNKMTSRPTTTFDVEYTHKLKNGKEKLKKEKVSIALSHCPHCGEKVAD